MITLAPVWVALAALVLQVLAAELGCRLGARHAASADDNLRSQAGAVEASVLALLGLLLAFSFTMALERYETRRALVVEEANAIGTAWLRSDALAPEARDQVHAQLRRYVDARLAFFAAGEDRAAIQAAVEETEALQRQLWAVVMKEANAEPASLPEALLEEALNTVIDLHASRLAAYDARVPPEIVGLLVAVASAALATVGFAFGLFRGPHRGATLPLALLVVLILGAILDLDQPRRGLIRVSQETMLRLRDSLQETPPSR